MLQRVIENFSSLEGEKIFIFNKDECTKFHLDNIVNLLISENVVTINAQGDTKGALCTCLLANDYINNLDELIISNSDQVIDISFKEVLQYFRNENVDCGVICFESVHPRWSYVKIKNGQVIEAAEKRPISKNAIAGFYYFKYGKEFTECAQAVLLKNLSYNGNFYISSTVNQMVLHGKKVSIYRIPKSKYASFYSPEKIKEFENR